MKKALDLFAGLGGMSFALTRFFDDIIAVENDPIAAEYHRANFPQGVIEQDVMELDPEAFRGGGFDHVHASPPCQSFSPAKGNKQGPTRDNLGMSQAVGRIIQQAQPETFTIENVPRYFKSQEYQALVGELGGDYVVQPQEFKAVDYGLPQSRIRVFALGVRADKFRFLVPPPRKLNTPGWATTLPRYIDEKLVVAGGLASWQNRVIKEQHPDGLREGVFLVKRAGYRKGNPILYPAGSPAPTITASRWHQLDLLNSETGETGCVTPRGLALIQGFPPSVKLPENPGEAVRLVGNAVPPPMGIASLFSLGYQVKREFFWYH